MSAWKTRVTRYVFKFTKNYLYAKSMQQDCLRLIMHCPHLPHILFHDFSWLIVRHLLFILNCAGNVLYASTLCVAYLSCRGRSWRLTNKFSTIKIKTSPFSGYKPSALTSRDHPVDMNYWISSQSVNSGHMS